MLQDVKDKAKAFIKRKIEQLTQEHAAALLSSQQQIDTLVSARSVAERERDEIAAQRDQLRQELQVLHSAAAPPQTAASSEFAAQISDDLARSQSELESLRAQLVISQRQLAESVDAAAAADAFRQKQLETEKARYSEELQAERKRSEAALSEARAQLSAALVDPQTAASAAAADESAKVVAERNAQLERESRELLQVKQLLAAIAHLGAVCHSRCRFFKRRMQCWCGLQMKLQRLSRRQKPPPPSSASAPGPKNPLCRQRSNSSR